MVTLDLLVMSAYLVGIRAAGWWAKGKITSQDEFLVAGRSVGMTLYAGTLAAVILGGASMMFEILCLVADSKFGVGKATSR